MGITPLSKLIVCVSQGIRSSILEKGDYKLIKSWLGIGNG